MDYYAHVKWFTDIIAEKQPLAAILSPFFMKLAMIITVLLAALTKFLPELSNSNLSTKVDRQLVKLRRYSLPILKYGTAAALLIQAASGTRFALEFKLTDGWQTILMWAAIILLLIPRHYATKIGALVLLVLFIETGIEAGIFHMLDYGFYLAIIGALLLERTKQSEWGFPLLYLGTGLSLCWVAVEKWIYPTMAEDIIMKHHVPTFGFDTSLFIVMAGFIEFVVGYLLVIGILNRMLSVVLTFIFISATMLFGMKELIGHFMIHIVLLLFIIEGACIYKKPLSVYRTTLTQMVFVPLNFIFVLATYLLLYYRFA